MTQEGHHHEQSITKEYSSNAVQCLLFNYFLPPVSCWLSLLLDIAASGEPISLPAGHLYCAVHWDDCCMLLRANSWFVLSSKDKNRVLDFTAETRNHSVAGCVKF